MTTGQEHLGEDFVVIDDPGDTPWQKLVKSVPMPSADDFKAEASLGFFNSRVGGMSRICDALGNYHATVNKVVEQKSTPITDTVVSVSRLIESINAEKKSNSDPVQTKAVEALSKKAQHALAVLEPAKMAGRRAINSDLEAQDRSYGHATDNKIERFERNGGLTGALFGKAVANWLDGEKPSYMSNDRDETDARIHERHGQLK